MCDGNRKAAVIVFHKDVRNVKLVRSITIVFYMENKLYEYREHKVTTTLVIV